MINLKSFFGRKCTSVMSMPKLEPASGIARRLAKEFALLQEIETEREVRHNPSYRKATEERIIWRELFDLELQEVDEQIYCRLPRRR